MPRPHLRTRFLENNLRYPKTQRGYYVLRVKEHEHHHEAEERDQLRQLLSKGKADVRRLKHAQILLAADESDGAAGRTDDSIADAVNTGRATVERVRRRFVEEGLELSLSAYRTPKRTYTTKLDGKAEARMIAIACSSPPDG